MQGNRSFREKLQQQPDSSLRQKYHEVLYSTKARIKMNPKLLLLFGIALLSAATSGSTVPPEKIPDEFSFYTEFKKFMGIYLEMKEIYFNFVKNNMECGDADLESCGKQLPYAQFTSLPQELKITEKDSSQFENKWTDHLASQIRGIKIFSETLLELVKHNNEYELSEGTQLNRMEKVANDLKNFIEPFANKLEEHHCVAVSSGSTEERHVRSFVSTEPLENVWDFLFLRQMYYYVNQVKYTLFYIAYQDPDARCHEPEVTMVTPVETSWLSFFNPCNLCY